MGNDFGFNVLHHNPTIMAETHRRLRIRLDIMSHEDKISTRNEIHSDVHALEMTVEIIQNIFWI
jgi:hypothetical protein